MPVEKKTLSNEEIQAQTALELQRELLQIIQSNQQTFTNNLLAVGVEANVCAVCATFR